MPSRLVPAFCLVLGASAIMPATAHAFAEDLCYVDGGGVTNCFVIPANCDPETNPDYDTPACTAATAAGGTIGAPGRSAIHVDATFYLARVVGLSADDAYWLAAYDEATDLGVYVPYDRGGLPMVDPTDADADFRPDACEAAPPAASCDLVTAPIDGVTRGNQATGGTLLHFNAPYHGTDPTPVPGVDGLNADPTDAEVEVLLANFRRWAFDGVAACAAGLTSVSSAGDYATGGACYLRDGVAAPIAIDLAAVWPITLPFTATSGLQIISETTSTPVTSDGLAAWVGDSRAPIARLGMYLHALQDRASHHICEDASHLTGPYATGDAFAEALDGAECGQIEHAARHAWETGVAYEALAERDRTTPATLAATFDELEAWAIATGRRTVAVSAARRTRVLDALADALAVRDATARVDALIAAGCALGYAPMPGQGGC